LYTKIEHKVNYTYSIIRINYETAGSSVLSSIIEALPSSEALLSPLPLPSLELPSVVALATTKTLLFDMLTVIPPKLRFMLRALVFWYGSKNYC